MILIQNINRLQQYNLARREKCYCEPVVNPRDVNLQGFLPLENTNNYVVNIYLFDKSGVIFRDNVTTDFKILLGTTIYNQRYFNVELKEFSSKFVDDCFILQIEVTNDGVRVFDMVTEMYCRRYGTTECFINVPAKDWFKVTKNGMVEIDCQQFRNGNGLIGAGYEIIYDQNNQSYKIMLPCDTTAVSVVYIQNSVPTCLTLPVLTSTTIEDDPCKLPLLELQSTFDCLDDITGHYFGDPLNLLNLINAPNDQTTIYRNHIWLESEIIKAPIELKRETNFLGKTQKTDYVRLFNFNGLMAFPDWKKEEIEGILSGKRVIINESEVVLRSGVVFEKDSITCTNSFLLKAKIESFPITNDFNCVDTCVTLCSYFVIPAGQPNQAYFGDNGNLIGYSLSSLLEYYRSYSGVVSVETVNTSALDCKPVAVFKVSATDYIPSFFYFGSDSLNNRVYAKRDDCANPTRLCEDFDLSCLEIGNVYINITEWIDPDCWPIVLDPITITDANSWTNCTYSDAGDWVNTLAIVQHDPFSQVRVQITTSNATFTDPDNNYLTNQIIGYLGTGCRPTTTKIFDISNVPNMPEDMQITILPTGEVSVSGFITFTPNGTFEIPLFAFTK